MKKYLFIINPIAGKGKALELIPQIESFFREDINFDIVITKEEGHGKKIAGSITKEKYSHVISVGGDGTLFEVLNGIKNKDIILGVIPAGTGNDLARTIQLPKKPQDVLSIIKRGNTKKIDIGRVNDELFLNVVSVGIDAEIAKETERIKGYVSGTMAYVLGVFKTLTKYKSKNITLMIDGKKFDREIELIAVGNGMYYGGGMKITPLAVINDGYLDICLVNRLSKLKLAALFPTVFKGKHIIIKDVEVFRGREIQIFSKEPLLINADGNIIGTTPAYINMENITQDIIVA